MIANSVNVRLGKGWALCAIIACLYIGCKQTDRDAPTVALSAPSDGFAVVADSDFVIAGVASDEQGLSSITATLFETETGVLIQSKTISITGLSSQFSFEMAAGDRYTTTGLYTLKVTAVDGAGNFGSAFTQIQIQELPLVYLGAVWAGDQGTGHYSLHQLDTAGTLHAGPAGLQALSGLLADNRNGQLVGVQSTPGWLRAWSMEGLDPLWQFDLPQGTGATTYRGISMNHNRYFAALEVPDYVRAYRFDGTSINGFEQALHPATAVLGTHERVYAGLQGVVGLPTKLDAYDAVGGDLIATVPLDWAVSGILPLNDAQLLVWGNEAGMGRLLVVDRVAMTVDQATPLTETLVAAATANGRAWVLTDQGLYEYFGTGGTLSGMLVAGTYTALAVDASSNRLLLGGIDRVEVRSGAGALLETHLGAFGQVQFIDIRYNK
jgi:hypothetical protein